MNVSNGYKMKSVYLWVCSENFESFPELPGIELKWELYCLHLEYIT